MTSTVIGMVWSGLVWIPRAQVLEHGDRPVSRPPQVALGQARRLMTPTCAIQILTSNGYSFLADKANAVMAPEDDRGLLRPLLPRSHPEPSIPAHQPLPTLVGRIPKRLNVKAACESCRQRKVKCDGHRPRCFPCAKSGRACEYITEPSETTVSAVKRKNHELRQRLADHTELQDLLIANPQGSSDIIKRLRSGGDIRSVIHEVQQGELLLSLAQGQYATSSPHSLESASYMNSISYGTPRGLSAGEYPMNIWHSPRHQLPSRFDHPEHIFEEAFRGTRDTFSSSDLFVRLSSLQLPISRWTTVSLSNELLNHIMLLFWTWDSRANRVLDRKMFEEDLQNLDPTSVSNGALRFCSPFLVNALLAVGRLYTTNSATYSVPSDEFTRGEAFAKEARRLRILERSETSLPFVQGLAIFYHYEGNFGTLESTIDITNTCYEQYKKLHLKDLIRKRVSATAGIQERREAQALSWIGWGFYIHENYFVGPMNRRKTLRKPDIPKLWQDAAQSSPEGEYNDYWWFAYPVSSTPQRSFRKEIFEAECDLIEIFEDIMDFLAPTKSDSNPFKAPEQALKLYRRLITLKYTLPEFLQAESSTLPTALQFYVNFDLILMSILRPFDDIAKDQFGGLDPKATSQFYASHIMSTIWTFRALYTWTTLTLGPCK
ncbi:hypothetical protein BFJ67_g16650 [Fusarium oxysporum f. sp. cepae]|nr:hypothetical protein BFJ67_g16650 [Fusarium oxysporum f. sp. cepae]